MLLGCLNPVSAVTGFTFITLVRGGNTVTVEITLFRFMKYKSRIVDLSNYLIVPLLNLTNLNFSSLGGAGHSFAPDASWRGSHYFFS